MTNEEIPYIAVGNDELNALPMLGETSTCPRCQQEHEVQNRGTSVASLQSISCPEGGSWLVGINGKDITKRQK